MAKWTKAKSDNWLFIELNRGLVTIDTLSIVYNIDEYRRGKGNYDRSLLRRLFWA